MAEWSYQVSAPKAPISQQQVAYLGNQASGLWEKAAQGEPALAGTWSWASWLLPLAGPLVSFLLILIFSPYILNLLTKIISSHLQAVKHQLLLYNQIILLRDTQPIPTSNPKTTISPTDQSSNFRAGSFVHILDDIARIFRNPVALHP